MSTERSTGGRSIHSAGRAAAVAVLAIAGPVFGGFASTESFLPAVGRVAGKNGAEFYTTVWATNLGGAPVHFTFEFLKAGQANPNPAKFTDTLAAGETKTYENVVESKLALSNALGAARILSDGEILVAERIYNQAPGADLGDTEGLFFAGVPKSFSITAGQSASIQGVDQGGSEDFRYNFALVETGGGSADVNVQVFDGNGTLLGQKAFPLSPYEQLQPGVGDVVSGIHTTNARITATVTSGTGSVLLAGAQLANVSQDSSGFEMSFRDDLLGSGGGGAGVTSLNGLTGALTLAHGANTTVNVSGSTITIDAVSGSGSGLTAVAHDNSLVGSGTVSLPLGIANGQLVRSVNGLHDALTLSAGSNVTITPSGNTLTIAASGGSGGLASVSHDGTLDGDGTSVNPLGIALPLVLHRDDGVLASLSSSAGPGVMIQTGDRNALTVTSGGTGYYAMVVGGVKGMDVQGNDEGVHVDSFGVGVGATGNPAIDGKGTSGADGVDGSSTSSGRSGVYGVNSVSGGYGVYGRSTNSGGVAVAGSGDNGGKAAHFYAGDVYIDHNLHVSGSVSKGGGSFEIDHPLDPSRKILVHSFVESPDMMNIYNGVARLDPSGTATIVLPDWFEALNREFRYQLTALDTPQPSLFVSRRVANHRFTIAGGVPGAEVSWQVTGIRHDRWAEAHRISVEVEKPAGRTGVYLHPELYGADAEKQINRIGETARPER